jgi:D-alanyl-lipoteichoic acid acyltransferase DltB (MBOAT superfamily)
MRFNSIEFLVFFPVVSIAFFIVPHKYRWLLLLGASYLFYMSWRPKYILVLLAVTIISYLAGLWLGRDKNPLTRRIILNISLFASLGILFFFKYFNLSNPIFQGIFDQWGISHLVPENILLPLGISFFTLQTMSYTLDVYRGIIKPEKHAGIYALFVAFFPQLVAGPIGRANLLLPQYYETHAPDYEKIVSGLQRMVWGLFKKLVVADRLALLVGTVYGDPTTYTGMALILATYAFAYQIYCDFSGYADIAIGAARVMGFELTENFQQPYYAQSIPDFWRRWHISLYSWLRDYIFYPIHRTLIRRQASSRNFLTTIIPPMVTMLASGLWHGGNWTFIIWGALHGIFMVVSILWSQAKKSINWSFALPSRLATGIKIFATFNLVSFAWIFFRANSLSDALYIIRHLFVNLEIQSSLFELMPGGSYEWTIAILAILLMETVHMVQMKMGSLRQATRIQPVWLRWSIYFGLVMVIFIFGKFESTEFIYSRF